MTQENDRLRAALEADDETFLNSLEKERGLFAQIGETFRGPMRLILWAGAAWAAWTLQIGIKQWIWSRVNTLSILREMKRMELRMAALEARLR